MMQDRSPAGILDGAGESFSSGPGNPAPLSAPHSREPSVLREKLVNQRCALVLLLEAGRHAKRKPPCF
jgi:hypothetical protein